MSNDAVIMQAALTQAASEGWPGLSFPRLSAASGLSIPPLRQRFAGRGQLAAQLWEQQIAAPLMDNLQAVVDAVPRPGVGAHDSQAPSARMIAAMRTFENPDERMLAASELVIMSRFEPVLAGVVTQTWHATADSWLVPRGGHLSRAQAARHAVAVAEALGLLLLARGIPSPVVDVQGPISAMVAAMAIDVQPRPLPRERAGHLDLGAVFNTDDPAWDALLQATLNEIGTRGFDAATLDLIAQASGYSRGIIQNRYPSKLAIFVDATRRMLAAAVILNGRYGATLRDRYSPGLAEAAMMREFMHPSRRLVRSISLEQMRMAWHVPDIAEAMREEVAVARREVGGAGDQGAAMAMNAEWHFGLALGQGAGALADLTPQAASLPYDVVFEPLNGAG